MHIRFPMKSQLNSLFVSPETKWGAYPFDQITPDSIEASLSEAIEEKKKEIEAIIQNPEKPTFANTIAALETSGEALETLCGAFYNLLYSIRNDRYSRLAEQFSTSLSELSSDIYLDPRLWQRVRYVYENRREHSYDSVEQRLLQQTYDAFVDQGATLSLEKKQEYREIREQLSLLSLRFSENKLKDENHWSYELAKLPDSMATLPPSILNDARQKAQEKGADGYTLTLSAPHYMAVMKFCTDSEIRKLFYQARQSVGYKNNEYNNVENIRRIVNLRLRLAQLLGYHSYADYVLKDRMLSSVDKVQNMLFELQSAFQETSREEYDTLLQEMGIEKMNPWDMSFYLERFREKRLGVKEEELRPYFPLKKVRQGIFDIAQKLYGIRFLEAPSVQVYHPEVQVFEVRDIQEQHLGLLYLDFFPRPGKQSGAWMNNLREQNGEKRPHIVLVMNFTPPSDTEVLLTPGEVQTFLHEFGHSLHGLLTRCRYSSMSGTNVARDFVELPSQFMENFLLDETSVREMLSEHYQSGEKIPSEWLKNLIIANKFPIGYSALRQLFFGKLDMAYHARTQPLEDSFDPIDLEKHLYQELFLWQDAPYGGCAVSTGFSHIFSGGYASGYYSYKWSEILEADAFAYFQENGLWSRPIANRFREAILERGDSVDPEEAYIEFRGKRPSIRALIERENNYHYNKSTISPIPFIKKNQR